MAKGRRKEWACPKTPLGWAQNKPVLFESPANSSKRALL